MHFIQEIKMFSCHKLNNWLYIVTEIIKILSGQYLHFIMCIFYY